MPSSYYTPTGFPASYERNISSGLRGEFDDIQAGFDLLPDLSSAGNRIPFINTGSTAIVTDANFTYNPTGSYTGDAALKFGTGAANQIGLIFGSGGYSYQAYITSTADPDHGAIKFLNDGRVVMGGQGTVFNFINKGINQLVLDNTAGSGIYVNGGAATTDVQAIGVTQTWNDSGTAFTAIKLNVTNTASDAASLLMDLQVGGVGKFTVDKVGFTTAGDMLSVVGSYGVRMHPGSGAPSIDFEYSGVSRNNITSVYDLPTDSYNLVFQADGAGILFSTGVNITGWPAISVDQTWNNVAATFVAIELSVANTASAADSLLMNLMVDGTGAFTVAKSGDVTAYSIATNHSVTLSPSTGEEIIFAYGGGTRAIIGGGNGGGYDMNMVAGTTRWTGDGAFNFYHNTGVNFYGGTATASSPLSWVQTWNNASVVFTALKLNVTNTASAAGSNLVDLQIGGGPAFSVNKAGQTLIGPISVGSTALPSLCFPSDLNTGFYLGTSNQMIFTVANADRMNFSDGLKLHASSYLGFTGTAYGVYGVAMDIAISRVSAGVLGIGNGTAGDYSCSLKLTTLITAGVTYSNLPGTPAAGMVAYVTDSNTATWGATVAGSGSNKVLVWYNGTNWTVAGA